MRACLVARSRECKGQAVAGQMRFGRVIFARFHFEISMHLIKEGKDYFTGWRAEAWGIGVTRWRARKKWVSVCVPRAAAGVVLLTFIWFSGYGLCLQRNCERACRCTASIIWEVRCGNFRLLWPLNLQINEISSGLWWSSEVLEQPTTQSAMPDWHFFKVAFRFFQGKLLWNVREIIHTSSSYSQS